MEWKPLSDEIDDVISIPVVTQTLPPHQHTNSYLVGRRRIGMIDAGLWDEEGVEALSRYFGGGTGRELAWLLLTHWHPDHRVGAEKIREKTGCRVGIHEAEREKVEDVPIDFTFRHGDRFSYDGKELEVIHTPGHSAGHCCFLARPQGVLFTGDHILGMGTSIIVPPDGDMTLYLESLARLLTCPAEVICPGHGPIVWNAREKIQEYIRHREEREAAILRALREGRTRTEDLVAAVYTDVPEALHGMAWFTVEAHLEKLRREGKIRRRPDGEGHEPA